MGIPKLNLDKLQALKDKEKKSFQAISDLSGVPLSTVNRVFRGESVPSVDNLAAIVFALNGSLDDVCDFPKKDGGMDDRLYQVMQQTIHNKEKWLVRVVAGCAVLVLFILGLFTYDLTHPDRGWFQEEDAQPQSQYEDQLEE